MLQHRLGSLAFKVTGFALLAGMLVWIGTAIPRLSRPVPQTLGFGNAFASNPQLPRSQVDAVLRLADEKLAARNHSGNFFHLSGAVAGWLSFLCTAVITLVAGYQGMVVDVTKMEREQLTELLRNRTARFVHAVGLLAAAAALCTALAARCNIDAEGSYKSADDLQKLINTTRRTLLSATTTEEAESVLAELRLAAQR